VNHGQFCMGGGQNPWRKWGFELRPRELSLGYRKEMADGPWFTEPSNKELGLY
jgi:hypothetical protein